MRERILIISMFMLLSLHIFAQSNTIIGSESHYSNSKPWTRYWWFASTITQEDVKYNLDWLKEHNYGGVEIAFVYPLNRFNPKDTSYTPRQEWLSPEWSEIVKWTMNYANSIGLGCDLTFGTLWPFGDSQVKFHEATQKYGEPDWRQEIRLTWEHPKTGYVIDHLMQVHYQPYLDRLLKAFPKSNQANQTAYFIDSWEVETEKLWSDDFSAKFLEKNGYDITKYMDSIYNPTNKHQLYDYMSLVSEKVLNFYYHFDSTLNSVGVLSRGQVSGAPCDLISGYALLDIPEGESMLFEPEFCAIPASAAMLSNKKVVTSETFTCLYGWPRDYIREEQTADLKLVADALFANGINQIIWHGKAHNSVNSDSVNFYATTHIGEKGNLQIEIYEFNNYLEKVSSYMKKGHTYSDVAVYLPTEDAWIKGIMPKDKQFKWAWGYYEMRYVYFPDELKGYNPTWINGEFLEKAKIEKNHFIIGDNKFDLLYVDVKFLDYSVLTTLLKFAEANIPIVLKELPINPSAVENSGYEDLVAKLRNYPNVSVEIPKNITKIVIGKEIPKFWSRVEGNKLIIFFPNPKSNFLKFPMEYGQSLQKISINKKIELNYQGKKYQLDLAFEPYQSLLFEIEDGKIEQIDIKFVPSEPKVKTRPEGYKAPWLVE
jgi:hypothetical protein